MSRSSRQGATAARRAGNLPRTALSLPRDNGVEPGTGTGGRMAEEVVVWAEAVVVVVQAAGAGSGATVA